MVVNGVMDEELDLIVEIVLHTLDPPCKVSNGKQELIKRHNCNCQTLILKSVQ